MIITKTPFRMSFFGGGTDVKDFYEENGGAVLSVTFDKYCYVNIRHLPRFFEYRSHLTYSKTERVSSYSEIQHPLIRNAMELLDIHDIRLMYDADLPARTGLGTSSAFAVGLLNALYSLKGKRQDKRSLADEAIYLERVLCKEEGGIQDQIASSFGGFNRIDIENDSYRVTPVVISNQRKVELNQRLMLFFTGFVRNSSDIQRTVNFTKTTEKILNEMKALVDEAENIITSTGKLDFFGKLLDISWELKRKLSPNISSGEIDEIYKRAKEAGAIGGKLLGAGGGGFLLLYVEPEYQENVKNTLKNFLYVPFVFEHDGTQVIYYRAEDYDVNQEG